MGVRDRQKQPDVALVVVIDKSGSMDACHCNSFNGGMGGGGAGIAGVQEGGHRQGGDPAGRVRADRPRTSWAWSRSTRRPTGWSRRRRWAASRTSRAQIAGIQPLGQTNIFAGLDQAVQSLENATATRRHIILLTDGWSSSGQYDDDPQADEGRRDHALDGRRGRRRQPVPGAAGEGRAAAASTPRPTRRRSPTSSSRRRSRSPASRSSRSRSSRS